MSPVAQPKIHEIADRRLEITDSFARTGQLNQMACKRQENDLNALCKSPEFEASARAELGVLFALKRNYAEAVRNLERAKALGLPKEPFNDAFILSSLYCGRTDVAHKLLKEREISADPDDVRTHRSMALQCGMYRLVKKCNEQLAKLGADARFGFGTGSQLHDSDVESAVALLENHERSDDYVAGLVSIASRVIAEKVKTPLVVYGFTASFDSGILYEVPLKLAIDDLIDIEWAISSALVEEDESYEPGLISFSARQHSESVVA